MRRLLGSCASLLAAISLALPAQAKVAFTGYGNFLMSADSYLQVRGPASVLGAIPEGNLIRKGFQLESAGLFASTKVGEDAEFLMDLTFRSIGTTVGQTRIQYAYLDAGLPWWELRGQIGRVTIPFNYYNTRRFYPFQRTELSAPLYINGILGLPIVDSGAVLSRRFALGGEWGLDARLYAVNGYGNLSNSSSSLRNPSFPGGLGVSGNLGASNNNKDIATGGQLAVGREGAGEVGASYYRGAWTPDDRGVLQMAGAHALWTPGRFDLLAEYLHVHATGDEGMAQGLRSPDWVTHGAFFTASHPLFRLAGREVIGWGHVENYHTRRASGGPGREVLRSYSGGTVVAVNEHLTLKSEGLYLFYAVPTNAQSIVLEGRIIRLAAVITF